MISKIAVLGAGVMGAQIAALCVNAGFSTLLFDLPAIEGNPNGIVQKALLNLKKLKPAPLGIASLVEQIIPANYDQHLALLRECDLIIEVVAERLDIKASLYASIAPYIRAEALLVTNTSGLSISALAKALPAAMQERFCGMHFFNPPRYMKLVELIPHADTKPAVLDTLENFLTTYLGKSVIRALDTPNFIANRIGVFSLLAMMHRAIALKIPFEVVDALTGVDFGRAKSALFRTMDVVGLDVLAHVVATMQDQLSTDPWHPLYQLPDFLTDLISKGHLGQKTGAGIYKKQGKEIWVWDLTLQDYRPAIEKANPDVLALLKIKNPAERLAALERSQEPEAQFLWHCLTDSFHYSAFHAETIAATVRDIDLAMRWGFAWKTGVFELWQQAGWSDIGAKLDALIAEGISLVAAPLPAWVKNIDAVYQAGCAYAPQQNTYLKRSNLSVYQRQLFPDSVLSETFNEGETLFETEAVRLWTLDQNVAILSFKSKMNAVGDDVLDGILAAVAYAEQHMKALVIWQRHGENFSVGANLKMVGEVYAREGIDGIKPIVEKFQNAALALRYCRVPTVAAVRGMALGGGCELMMHCTKIVSAFESYIGLVEVGVGLLPAGGGLKEFAQRAWTDARGDDPYRDLIAYFKQIAMGEVSSSALDAKARHFLKSSDTVIMHPDELLFVALAAAKALSESVYLPPLSVKFPVVGKPGIANFEMLLVNMRAGDFISEYDFEISLAIATVLCGGEIEAGSIVDEAWFLRLEREAFYRLAAQSKTQERIAFMLTKGKALRN